MSDVLSYLKSPLMTTPIERIDALENYCRAFDVQKAEWLQKGGWDFAPEDEKATRNEPELDILRRVVIAPLKVLQKAITTDETISAEQALVEFDAPDVVFVDLRDVRELKREGKIPGAFHCPRGLLEFWIDPECQYYNPVFDVSKRFVFYCNLGWRSALAADVARQMGLRDVCHIGGGFEAWKSAGGAVEEKK